MPIVNINLCTSCHGSVAYLRSQIELI
jgi:hypothetical protein